MFDTIRVGGDSRHYHQSETHEHRAPTDESVRLLHEMEQAAEKKLVSAMRLDANEFKATWHVFHDGMSLDRRAVIRFNLNDCDYEHEICLQDTKFRKPEDVVREIHRALTEKIAAVITMEVLAKADELKRIMMR